MNLEASQKRKASTELRMVPEDTDGGTFASCSAESEKRSPEGGRGGMKGQEDLCRIISYRRTKWSFGPAWRYGGGIFHIMKGLLIHMGHCEIVSHLCLSPAGDKGCLSWRLCVDIAAG